MLNSKSNKIMKHTSKALVLFLLSLGFFNCQKEESIGPSENNEIIPELNMLSFSNFQEFDSKINELSVLSSEEIENWAIENNSNSLLDYMQGRKELEAETEISEKAGESVAPEQLDFESEYLDLLPLPYKALFNNNLEVLINNKVIWLKDGKLHEFSMDQIGLDYSDLSSEDNIIGEITLQKSTNIEESENSKRFFTGELGFTEEKGFAGTSYRECNTTSTVWRPSTFRYIHEFVSVHTKYDKYIAISKLYYRARLQYFKRRQWRVGKWEAAGEHRTINMNFNFAITLSNGGGGLSNIPLVLNSSVNQSFTCSRDQSIMIAYTPNSYDVGFSGMNQEWGVSGSGTITQEIAGGFNRWSTNLYY